MNITQAIQIRYTREAAARRSHCTYRVVNFNTFDVTDVEVRRASDPFPYFTSRA